MVTGLCRKPAPGSAQEPASGAKVRAGRQPGLRTGCKLAVIDGLGPAARRAMSSFPTITWRGGARQQLKYLEICERCAVEVIAVGNGTAGRETEAFLQSLKLKPPVIMSLENESGASVYSVSDAARREFPDEDATVRGAISIGRRLMDPLAAGEDRAHGSWRRPVPA